MRLRSGIRCDVLVAAALALAALLAFVPTVLATPPTEVPAGLHVHRVDARTIEVAWLPWADSSLVPELTIATTGHPETARIRTLGENSTAWAEGVRCGESLTFTLVLRNADGEVGPPVTLTQASDPCDPGPPAPPTSVEPVLISGGAVGIGWDLPSSNDVSVAELTAYGPDGFTATRQAAFFDPGASIQGLTCGTAYTFQVTFIDSDGERSKAVTTHAETLPCASLGPAPDPLPGLRTEWISPIAVMFRWNALPPDVIDVVVTIGEQGGSRTTSHVGPQPQGTSVRFATCGPHLATITALYSDGRVSKPATISFKSICPPPASTITKGPIPYHRAGITLHRQARVTVARNGSFVLPRDTVQCPAAGGNCRVLVRVETRIPGKRGLGPLIYLGNTETTLTPGAVRTLTGRLSPRGRALLLRRGRLPVTITIEAWHVAGLYAVTKHTTFVPARRR